MEDTLREEKQKELIKAFNVLILVLMEDTLRGTLPQRLRLVSGS